MILAICILLGVATYMGVFTKKKKPTDRSDIKNPTKPLPPSSSTLHLFKKAAVCADGPPCAEIGRSVFK